MATFQSLSGLKEAQFDDVIVSHAIRVNTLYPQYNVDVSGSINAKAIFLNGVNITNELTVSGVSAGTFGQATRVPSFTVDVYGRLTYATDTAISISSANVTAALGFTPYS